ncbi:MAG: AAA family ATPase, partial [Duncaniella sp.]|nr:AAA family ATPase [Duncaniella sp.]
MKVVKYETGGESDTEEPVSHSASATPAETLQQIYFGAPGVGKSHNLKSVYGSEDDVIRITFHPETDYAAFVGCYKPQTETRDDGTAEIMYKFQGQAFAEAYIEAWRRFVTDVPRKDQFLVIEGINRGNCAQIFGDIFQLLDRNENGFSDYSIRPDKDLSQYLCDEFSRLSITGELNNIKEGLGDGKWMMLPPNLHILATMNTSDQSLFPIDSAFRRRWEWVYMPVETEPSHKGEPVKRFIETNEYSYDWGKFLAEVNKRIFSTTLSEDKQLGFWFIKPKGGKSEITANEFVSKVIFYLWNDVYKDFGEDATSIFNFAVDGNPDSKEKIRHTFRDFTPAFRQVNHDMVDSFLLNLGVTPEKSILQAKTGTASEPSESATE